MMKLTILAVCITIAACGSYLPETDADGNPIIVPTKPPVFNPRCPRRARNVCKGKFTLRAYKRNKNDETGREFIECRALKCFRCPRFTRFLDECQTCVHERDFDKEEVKERCLKRMEEEEKEQEEKDPICYNDSCPFCPKDDIRYQYPAFDNRRVYCQCPHKMDPIRKIYPFPVCNICPAGTVFKQPEVGKSGCCVAPGHEGPHE
eukprot:TCONS_00070576-protein